MNENGSTTSDPVRNVVFSSGAMGGLSLIGAWRALESRGIARTITGMSGCSMGSIIATLASLGFNSYEMEIIARKFRYEDYAELSVGALLTDYGLETGRRIMRLLGRIIKAKVGRGPLTFAQHWRLTGRKLWINASCVETGRTEYYSVETTPNMTILAAIRRSIAIPYLFTAVRDENGQTYVDGGCYDPLPTCVFGDPLPRARTYCFSVRNRGKRQSGDNVPCDSAIPCDGAIPCDSANSFSGLLDFSVNLVGTLFAQFDSLRFQKQRDQGWNIIYIDTGLPSLTMSLDQSQITTVIMRGTEVEKDL